MHTLVDDYVIQAKTSGKEFSKDIENEQIVQEYKYYTVFFADRNLINGIHQRVKDNEKMIINAKKMIDFAKHYEEADDSTRKLYDYIILAYSHKN